MRRVIIPSAVLVPQELQNMGKLPPIIYPVNQNIVFDFLYKQYNNIAESFNIACFEGADKIHRCLEKYESEKIHLIDLQILEDLGHTIYHSMDFDSDIPIIINFADTIVMCDIFENDIDCFFYQEDYVNDQWTYFEEQEGVITDIIDKQSICSEEKKKLFVGVFQISYPKDFKKCLEWAFNSTTNISTFYSAIKMYSEMHPMIPIHTSDWFDIGHVDKYYSSSLEVKAREFNHITIDKKRGILRKTSIDKEKFIGEIMWYLKLPHDIEYVRPRIFQYSINYNNPYIEMEYYAYHTVHELYLYSDLSYSQWKNIFKRIKFICDDFFRYRVNDSKIRLSLEDMYLNKTQTRLEVLRRNVSFKPFFENAFYVNDIKYQSLDAIMDKLQEIIENMLYDVESFCIIHGDLCFANIMVDPNFNFIKMIDPRGKFGYYDIYGDKRYELAKLFHSIDGKYDFIIKDLFQIDVDMNKLSIQYNVFDRVRDYDLFEIFISVFKEDINKDKSKIELIEALLFLSMIPLHNESQKHQFAMLATGIQILNRVINIREDI